MHHVVHVKDYKALVETNYFYKVEQVVTAVRHFKDLQWNQGNDVHHETCFDVAGTDLGDVGFNV